MSGKVAARPTLAFIVAMKSELDIARIVQLTAAAHLDVSAALGQRSS
jgi:hypothetical protein